MTWYLIEKNLESLFSLTCLARVLCRLKREPNTISSWYLVHERNGYKFFNIPKTLVNFLYIFLIDQLEYLPTMSYSLETKRNSWRQRFDRWFQLKRWWCWQFQCISKNLLPVISNLHIYVKKFVFWPSNRICRKKNCCCTSY